MNATDEKNDGMVAVGNLKDGDCFTWDRQSYVRLRRHLDRPRVIVAEPTSGSGIATFNAATKVRLVAVTPQAQDQPAPSTGVQAADCSERVERPFAYCCAEAGGRPEYCDCVEKDHATAFFPSGREVELQDIADGDMFLHLGCRYVKISGERGSLQRSRVVDADPKQPHDAAFIRYSTHTWDMPVTPIPWPALATEQPASDAVGAALRYWDCIALPADDEARSSAVSAACLDLAEHKDGRVGESAPKTACRILAGEVRRLMGDAGPNKAVAPISATEIRQGSMLAAWRKWGWEKAGFTEDGAPDDDDKVRERITAQIMYLNASVAGLEKDREILGGSVASLTEQIHKLEAQLAVANDTSRARNVVLEGQISSLNADLARASGRAADWQRKYNQWRTWGGHWIHAAVETVADDSDAAYKAALDHIIVSRRQKAEELQAECDRLKAALRPVLPPNCTLQTTTCPCPACRRFRGDLIRQAVATFVATF